MQRKKLLDASWFKQSRRLAIADVVYIAGVGLCSHQPELGATSFKGHRMKDMDGNIQIVTDDDLFFQTTREERDEYWQL